MTRWSWGALIFVAALGMVGGAGELQGGQQPVPEGLTGAWTVIAMQPTGGVRETVLGGFDAHFGADGRLVATADCNRCYAAWESSPGTLQLGLMSCTLAACSSSPLDAGFVDLLASATTWRLERDRLELRSAAGVVTLVR